MTNEDLKRFFNTIKNESRKNGFVRYDENGNIEDFGIDGPIKKLQNYLYHIKYKNIDYTFAKQYFENEEFFPPIGGCSSVRNGNFYGRNFDWLYSEDVEFVVQTKNENGKCANIGVTGSIRNSKSAITKSFVEEARFNDLYKILPFMIVDGINEFGVVCNTNVVPKQKNNGNLIFPSGEIQETMCDLMLIRYILDNFESATDAVEYISEHCAFYPSKTLSEKYNYDLHWMIADEESTYLIEFVNSSIVITDLSEESKSDLAGKTYMTNFYLDGVTLNSDGKVYTPATQTIEYKPTTTNGITTLGSGLERYNKIVDNFEISNTKEGMLALMELLYYSESYGSAPYVSIPFRYTEYVGLEGPSGILTVDSKEIEFGSVIAKAAEKFANRSRDVNSENFGTWQTNHCCVYDIQNKTLLIKAQEDKTKYYNFVVETSNGGGSSVRKTSQLINDGDGINPFATIMPYELNALTLKSNDLNVYGIKLGNTDPTSSTEAPRTQFYYNIHDNRLFISTGSGWNQIGANTPKYLHRIYIIDNTEHAQIHFEMITSDANEYTAATWKTALAEYFNSNFDTLRQIVTSGIINDLSRTDGLGLEVYQITGLNYSNNNQYNVWYVETIPEEEVQGQGITHIYSQSKGKMFSYDNISYIYDDVKRIV